MRVCVCVCLPVSAYVCMRVRVQCVHRCLRAGGFQAGSMDDVWMRMGVGAHFVQEPTRVV